MTEVRELLQAANVWCDPDDPELAQCLNQNDVWGWALADCEEVPDSELPRVGDLFWRYGWCGILYWVSQRRNGSRSEFQDVNRFIEFVAREEAIREEEPDSSKRAYLKREYAVGCPEREVPDCPMCKARQDLEQLTRLIERLPNK
jgi:hypothetical protein